MTLAPSTLPVPYCSSLKLKEITAPNKNHYTSEVVSTAKCNSRYHDTSLQLTATYCNHWNAPVRMLPSENKK